MLDFLNIPTYETFLSIAVSLEKMAKIYVNLPLPPEDEEEETE